MYRDHTKPAALLLYTVCMIYADTSSRCQVDHSIVLVLCNLAIHTTLYTYYITDIYYKLHTYGVCILPVSYYIRSRKRQEEQSSALLTAAVQLHVSIDRLKSHQARPFYLQVPAAAVQRTPPQQHLLLLWIISAYGIL